MDRTFQTAVMEYIQSCDIFPEFCMQLFLDKAIQILHSTPDAHRIGFMDSTGNLIRITKARASWYKKIQNYCLHIFNCLIRIMISRSNNLY